MNKTREEAEKIIRDIATDYFSYDEEQHEKCLRLATEILDALYPKPESERHSRRWIEQRR